MERGLQPTAESIDVIDSESGHDPGERHSNGPDRPGDPNQLSENERKSRKRFNPNLDVVLLREVHTREPYAAPHGKVNETWEEVTQALNDSGTFPWKVDSRMARDRFVILERWLKKHDMENLRRGAGEVFELREHLLTQVVASKDSYTLAKEEKRGDRDGKKDSLGGYDRKRDYLGDSDDPEAKRIREMQTLKEFIAYMKDKDNSANELQRKRVELDEIRLQAEIQDRRKQQELDEKRLEIENARLAQAGDERKVLYQILHYLQTMKGETDVVVDLGGDPKLNK